MIENGGGCCDSCDDEFREWCNGYKKRKAKKAQIKAELLPIAWHPDRVIMRRMILRNFGETVILC